MKLNRYKEVLENDLYFIASRLKEIDEGYFMVLDKRTGRCEIHNRDQRGDTYCLTCPSTPPDARALTLVLRTRRERAKALFAELERENERREREEKYALTREAEYKLEKALSSGN